MYQSIYISNWSEECPSQVYIWGDGLHNDAGLKIYDYKQFKYAFRRDPNGKYTSIYGDKLKKITRWKKEEDASLFESDIPRETRVLSDLYDSDEPSKNHRYLILDIETNSSGGFAPTSNPFQPIISISALTYTLEKPNCEKYVWVLDIDDKCSGMLSIPNTTIKYFKKETDLLMSFLEFYVTYKATIISGWNCDNYDIPYLYNRLSQVFDLNTSGLLSSINSVKFSELRKKYTFGGISVIDYLPLYKKFTYIARPNYRLNTIAEFELGRGKVEYDGTLDDLYNTDRDTFIKYNLVDVELVFELEEKLKFIELARFISHVGKIPYEDYMYSSRFIEGAILTHLHKNNIICPNKPINGANEFAKREDGIAGAYVKDVIPGRYEWISVLDIQSLYPNIMRSLNISPDSKLAKIQDWNIHDYLNSEIQKEYTVNIQNQIQTFNKQELKNFIETNNLVVSSNGICFNKNKKGILPEIIDKWFAQRLEYKKLQRDAKKSGNTELEEYYDRRQHVQKIFLNSVYGSCVLPIFRFHDLDNALAITATGQDIIKTSGKRIQQLYEKKINTQEHSDYITYIDTDSLHFSSSPLLPEDANYNEQLQFTVDNAKELANDLNSFYDIIMKKMFFCDSHSITIKGESVNKSAFWTSKKRYAFLKVYDLDNDELLEEPEFKTKGLDVVRSSFPSAFQNFTKEILIDILNNSNKIVIDNKIVKFRETLPEFNYKEIIPNTSVKELSKYDKSNESSLLDFIKGTPIHAKSSLIYNRLLKTFGIDTKYESIRDGDKIKWCPLSINPYNIETIAVKGINDPPEILQLIQNYIDYDSIFERQLKKKLLAFYIALGWGDILPTDINSISANFFDFG